MSASSGVEPHPSEGPTRRAGLSWRSAPRSHRIALYAMMAAYVAVAVSFGYLRLLEFTTTNWDMGIFQQSLWTAAHGQNFFSSGNYESSGAVSFLQVHPALILYAFVPFYALAPSPMTLLVIQAIAVAGCAVPLYQIGRRLLPDARWALAMAGLYLVYGPVLTSNLYDFHLEAFVPIEIFLLFLLWYDRRYRLALLVAAVSFVTLEVTPFFVAALALYFLAGELHVRWPWAGPNVAARPRDPAGRRLISWLRRPTVRWGLGLLVFAAVAYVLLRVFEWWLLPAALGVPPGLPPGVTGIGGVASSTGLGLSFDWGRSLPLKLGYWVTLIGLLAFLPLLAPRAWILALPWLFFTFQADKIPWVVFGFQYGFLAMTPVILAALLGLKNFEERFRPGLVARWQALGRRRPRATRWTVRAGPRTRRALLVTGLAILVAVNLSYTPANPLRQNLNSSLSGYRVSYTVTPGYDAVVRAAALIPGDAWVLASDNLFPFVANNPNAYSFLWVPSQPKYFPFDPFHLPQYVFLSSSQQYTEPSWLDVALSNQSLYGLLAHVASTPAGSVSLWERGYTGAPIERALAQSPASGADVPGVDAAAVPFVADSLASRGQR